MVAIVVASSSARAQDLADRASQLADAAFVMLNSLNSASADSSTGGPLLAPTADLASNAQALANALKKGDRGAAGNAMAAIVRDQAMIDPAAKGASAVITAEWGSVKTQIAMLEKDVPPVEAPATAASPPSTTVEPPVASSRDTPAAPKVIIESSTPDADGDYVLVKGYLQGTDLKDAGVYDGATKRKDINVAGVPGQQRVNFQFKIESPAPDETIRVSDVDGREASAFVTGGGAGAAAAPPPSAPPDSSAEAASPPPSDEDNSGGNTAEIPAAGYSTAGPTEPTRRLTSLGNTQVTIVALGPVPGHPGSYEVLGAVSGRVRKAGVYINGRMVTPIRLTPGPYSSFDVIFTRLGTQNATIRAYGMGSSDFVETPLAAGGSGVTTFNNYRPSYPYGAAPSVPPPGGYP
jgi:hypothetical protein